ncbi:hypothetical protein M3Y97_01075800 [Aphelenchoides bicaudatus]|nr:hypothetical protein M3Y97_01075800 [Aphelenchoides bicaudatus]
MSNDYYGWLKAASRIYVFLLTIPFFYGIQELVANKKSCFWDEQFFLGVGTCTVPIIILGLALYGERTGRWKLVVPYFFAQVIITVLLVLFNVIALITLFYLFGKMYLDCNDHNRMNAGNNFCELLKVFLVTCSAMLVNIIFGLCIFTDEMAIAVENQIKQNSATYGTKMTV